MLACAWAVPGLVFTCFGVGREIPEVLEEDEDEEGRRMLLLLLLVREAALDLDFVESLGDLMVFPLTGAMFEKQKGQPYKSFFRSFSVS